jgi:hypothetical protein
MGKVASSATNSSTTCDTEPQMHKKPTAPRKAIAIKCKAAKVPKPRRPYKSMDQQKLVLKHEQFQAKLQLAQKRMENVKAKFDRFEAEIKLRSTAITTNHQAESGSDDEDDNASDIEANNTVQPLQRQQSTTL